MPVSAAVRRIAREQDLPASEADLLRKLPEAFLPYRIKDLYNLGWPMRAMRECLTPPPPSGTVRAWCNRPTPANVRSFLSKLPAMPKPTPPASVTKVRKRGGKSKKYPPSPGLTAATTEELANLSYYAQRYRSGMAPTHKCAIANHDFTQRLRELRDSGVTIAELADAADVTYRSIARRLSYTKSTV